MTLKLKCIGKSLFVRPHKDGELLNEQLPVFRIHVYRDDGMCISRVKEWLAGNSTDKGSDRKEVSTKLQPRCLS